jgi:hypothetical protein
METYVVAIAIAIIIIVTIIIARAKSSREALTTDQCGNSSIVSVPHDPLSRYDFNANVDSANFADLTHVSSLNSNIAQRHKDLANACDGTPGCVAFTSNGYLKSGVLPAESRDVADFGCTPCGLYARKCATPEPLYAEFYLARNYGGTRFLVPPGGYPDVEKISNALDGGTIKNDGIQSMKVPVGLIVYLFCNRNLDGTVQSFPAGNYPDLTTTVVKNCVSSIQIFNDRKVPRESHWIDVPTEMPKKKK